MADRFHIFLKVLRRYEGYPESLDNHDLIMNYDLSFSNVRIVTSSKRRHKNSMKCAIAKILNQDGRPDRYWKLKRRIENSAKHPPPDPRENTPSQKYPRNRRVVPSPSEDVPAASRTRRMAQEMKKLRSSHILRVPPSRSKTKAR